MGIASTTRSYTFVFGSVIGSVVKVSLANQYLSLAEVQVFGFATTGPKPTPVPPIKPAPTTPSKPVNPPSGASKPGYSCEGANQKKNLGTGFKTPQQCLAAAVADSGCGSSIMWSKSYNYAWGCRCCVPGATYTKHNNWDIYQTPPSRASKPGYSCEGANQKKNLGTGFKTPQQCLAAAVADSG